MTGTKRGVRGTTHVILMVASGFMAIPTADADEPAYALEIPAQDLDGALKAFAVETDRQVLFAASDVKGHMSPAINGEYSTTQALELLLADTDLVYEVTRSDVLLVRPDNTVMLQGVMGDQRGDSDSKNSTPKPVLMAQDQTTAPRRGRSLTDSSGHDSDEADAGIIQLEEIIVTGTNIRGGENPTTPVLQFDREDIDLSGALTVEDFLRTIPQNFGSETPISQNSANPFDTTSNLSQGTSVDLRGLGAGTTLTLLNGRRMSASGLGSFVDVSVLPLGAIERIDVLTDGASAVYGADAVGGVVNFVTRNDYEGFDVSARYGTVADGSKDNLNIGGAGGVSWSSGGAFVGVDFTESSPLRSNERDFIDVTIANPDGTIGAEAERVSLVTSINQSFSPRLTFNADALLTKRETEFDQQQFGQITARSEQEALFLNTRLEYALSSDLLAELFFDYSEEILEDSDSRDDFGPLGQNRFENSLTTLEARLSGSVLELPAGKLSFAVGAAYREESYEDFANFANVPGGEVDDTGSREVSSVYGEAIIPIVGEQNNVPFVKELDLSIAGRFEDYSDFGDAFTPKIGLYWAANEELNVRASYSESFRAPPILSLLRESGGFFQPFLASSITAFEPPVQDTRLPDGQVALLAFTRPGSELTEETAENFTAGFAYNPSFAPEFTIDLNYFDISFTNRVESVSFLFPLQNPAFSSLVQVNPDPSSLPPDLFDNVFNVFPFLLPEATDFLDPSLDDIQVFVESGSFNIAERDVRGLDFGINYQRDTDIGEFAATLNASYLIDYQSRLSSGLDLSDDLNLLYRPIDLGLRGALTWSSDGLTVQTAFNHRGGYQDDVNDAIANDIDAWTTVDLSVAYNTGDSSNLSQILREMTISASFQNLFDEEPPFVQTTDGLNYDPANANPFGRMVTIGVSKRF